MNLEFNKIFAALLVAGITASTAHFVSYKVMGDHHDAEDAVPIEGVETVDSGLPPKPKGPDPVLHLIAAADVARGEKLSKACAACHSFDKGGPHGIGPNLWNTVGKPKGSHEGYSYSAALLEQGGDWGYLSLNKFLYKPKDYMPGTKMNYIGNKKPEDRAAIIAWLRTLADDPYRLPTDQEIAAEKAELAPEPEEPEQPSEEETESLESHESAQEEAEPGLAEDKAEPAES
jgi:cytochrome c